jgi:signal transduction histidine kinase
VERRAAAFARLFEAVREGVYIGMLSPESTSTVAANPHLKLIFGYPSEAPEAEIRPLDRERFIDPQARVALLERLAIDGSVADYLLRLRRADNTAVWIELTARADPPAADGTLRVEALARDVSERKKLDDDTRDIYHQLLQAEKMAALGQTISGVAHELNNPLATIAGCAEALKERAHDPHLRDLDAFKDFPSYLGLIEEEAYRCKEITGSLLHFVRDPGSRRAPTDLNMLADKVLELIGHQSRYAQSRFERRFDAEMPDVVANEGQLRQVFLGLASNALDAMDGRGTLTVTTRRRNAKEVEIAFTDEGPGIPEHILPRVFDPFFTTKPPGQGTGLGLAIAQGFVADHDGRFEVDSRVGAGATFRVILPVTRS